MLSLTFRFLGLGSDVWDFEILDWGFLFIARGRGFKTLRFGFAGSGFEVECLKIVVLWALDLGLWV